MDNNDSKRSRSPIFNITTATTRTMKFFIDSIDPDSTPPIYLQMTNPIFEQKINEIKTNIQQLINIEQLRQVALVMDQCHRIDLEKLLWSTILKSGNGTLKIATTTTKFHYWPELVKSKIVSKETNQNLIDEFYLQLTMEYLQRLEYLHEQSISKFNTLIKTIPNFQTIYQTYLETYITQQLEPIKHDIQYKIKMIEYDYEDQRLRDEIEQYILMNNNTNNINEQLFELKYEFERSRQELKLLEQNEKRKQLPKFLSKIDMTLPIYIETIQDQQYRQQMIDQHENIIQQYKNKLNHLWIHIYQTFINEKQPYLNDLLQKLDPSISSLVEQRFKIIEFKIGTIYHHDSRSTS